MKGRNKLLLGVVVLLLLVLGVVVVTGRREPSYQGKSLSYWVLRAAKENTNSWMIGQQPRPTVSPEVEAAIRSIGTNGIPFYLEWLPYQPSRSVRMQMSLASFSRKIIGHNWRPNEKPILLTRGSAAAFSILKESAAPAIPKLVFYATNETNPSKVVNQIFPIQCLAEIGVPALPALIGLMDDGKTNVQGFAKEYFRSLRFNKAITDELKLLLEDADPGVRRDATNALERMGLVAEK